MAGFMDANTNNLHRTNLWSRQIKGLLLDELNAMKFVRIISDLRKHKLQGRSDKTTPYAGNSLELETLLRKSVQDLTISRKGNCEYESRVSVASGYNGR